MATDAERKQYIYKPLDHKANEIRLIRLLPELKDGLLQIEILHANLDDAPEYVALSYMWGKPDPVYSVLVEGTVLPIRKTLWQFLNKLRDVEYHDTGQNCLEFAPWPPIWVDQITINQALVEERNHQVGAMSIIYSRAVLVVAWLGSSGEVSAQQAKEPPRCLLDQIRCRLYASHQQSISPDSDIYPASLDLSYDQVCVKSVTRKGRRWNVRLQDETSISSMGFPKEGIGHKDYVVVDLFGCVSQYHKCWQVQPSGEWIETRNDSCTEAHRASQEDEDMMKRMSKILWGDVFRQQMHVEANRVEEAINHEYWTRLWIIQEFALAKRIILLDDQGQLDQSSLAKFLKTVLRGYIDGYQHASHDHILSVLTSQGCFHSTLAQTLRRFCLGSRCEVVCDAVHGLQGLVTEFQRVDIDYAQSGEKLLDEVLDRLCWFSLDFDDLEPLISKLLNHFGSPPRWKTRATLLTERQWDPTRWFWMTARRRGERILPPWPEDPLEEAIVSAMRHIQTAYQAMTQLGWCYGAGVIQRWSPIHAVEIACVMGDELLYLGCTPEDWIKQLNKATSRQPLTLHTSAHFREITPLLRPSNNDRL